MMIRCEEKTAFQRRVRVEVVVVEVGLPPPADQLSTCESAAVALRPSPSAHLTRREFTSHTSPKVHNSKSLEFTTQKSLVHNSQAPVTN